MLSYVFLDFLYRSPKFSCARWEFTSILGGYGDSWCKNRCTNSDCEALKLGVRAHASRARLEASEEILSKE